MATAQINTAELQPNTAEHKALIELASRYYSSAVQRQSPHDVHDHDPLFRDVVNQNEGNHDDWDQLVSPPSDFIELATNEDPTYHRQTPANNQSNHKKQHKINHRQLLKHAYDLAIEAYDKDPTYLPGINLLARIELQRQRIHQAERWTNRGLAIKPDSASLLYSAGHIALAEGNLIRAEDCFFNASKISRVSTKASLYLAHVKLLRGDYTVAFELYRELAKTHSYDPQVRNKLVEAASHIVADNYSVELEQDLLRYLQFEDIDYTGLRPLATSLLKHKLQLSEAGCPLELEQLLNDPLLQQSLQKFYFTDPVIEQLLMTLRQSLLISSSQSLSIDQAAMPMVIALASQNTLNESVWAETDQEIQILQSLVELAASLLSHVPDTADANTPETGSTPTQTINADDIYPLILLITLYRPLSSMAWFPKLLEIAAKAEQWPQPIRSLIQLVVEQPQQLQRCAQQIKRLPQSNQEHRLSLKPTNLAVVLENREQSDSLEPTNPTHLVAEFKPSVSTRVAKQYDDYPYPRWTSLGYQQKSDYHLTLKALFPTTLTHLNPPKHDFRILVAGCGTGRHALTLARYFDHCQVLAIDLSRQALAYAQYQADQLQMKNINFIQGDILNLDQLSEQFDVIETSGVLHHMASPTDGLLSLTRRLKPGGLIKIGLYSEAARQSISRFRRIIKDGLITSGDSSETVIREAADIRYLRAALIHQQIPGDWQPLLASADFYSLSACRDLLFHEQEHVFNHSTLSNLIEQSGCEWVGMVPPSNCLEMGIASEQLPKSLDQWCELEHKHPDLFAGMYQFYLRKPFPSGTTELAAAI